MPRRKPARRQGPPPRDLSRILETGARTETFNGRSYVVRPVRGNLTGRVYRCPGCQHEVSSAIAHVVVWPADGLGDVADRRHWHTGCWAARDRRRPRGSWR